MSQNIVSRTISAATDKRAALASGQLMRKIEMLDNWSVMRLGLQISYDASANATGTPLLFMGLCHDVVVGTGYADGSGTVHCLGARMGTSSSWTYHAGPPKYYDGGVPGIVKKIAGTVTTSSFGTGFGCFLSADPVTARTALILQITKGSPNFTLDIVAPQSSGAAAQIDCTDALFTSLMEMGAMSNANSIISGYANWTAGTIAVDQTTNGVLDSVCLHWDKSVPILEISQVAVRKVS